MGELRPHVSPLCDRFGTGFLDREKCHWPITGGLAMVERHPGRRLVEVGVRVEHFGGEDGPGRHRDLLEFHLHLGHLLGFSFCGQSSLPVAELAAAGVGGAGVLDGEPDRLLEVQQAQAEEDDAGDGGVFGESSVECLCV